MTIVLPSVGDQLKGSMEGIRRLIANIANPNAQEQMALRQALLEGRVQPDDLTDPTLTERRFGKGTGGFAEPTLRSEMEKVDAAEIQRILALPPDNPERQEFISKRTGTKTSTERAADTQRLTIGDQTIESNRTTLQKQAEERARETENRVLANQAISRIGGKENLYSAYQNKQLSTQEVQAIQATKDYDEVFRFQRDDYWKKQEMDFRERALTERLDPTKAAKEHNILLARKIVDTTSLSNVQDVNMVLEDRTLEKMFDEQMKGKKELTPEELASLTPTQQRMYAAVKAVKMNRQMEGDDRKRTALEYFRKQTSGIAAMFRDKKRMEELGDAGIQAQVDEYNRLAQQLLGSYLEDKDIPEIGYGKEGPRGKDAGFLLFDEKTVYQKKGMPAFEGETVENAAKADPLESYKGKSKEQIDMALSRADSATAANIRQQLMKRGWYK